MFAIIYLYFFTYSSCAMLREYNPPNTVTPPNVLDFKVDFNNLKKLPRFWTNTGFCPPAPTNHSSTLADFFLSEKSIQNIEYISALPNSGLKNIRIHWLLNLIKFM